MKTKYAILILTLVVWACNQPGTKTDNHEAEKTTEAVHEHGMSAPNGLTLNNGAKWVADESTNSQVKNLQGILDRFETEENKSMETYLNLSNELQGGIDALVQGCRMQGPDHDALHLWLMPLMENVKALQESTAMEQAVSNYDIVRKQVGLYAEYFQ